MNPLSYNNQDNTPLSTVQTFAAGSGQYTHGMHWSGGSTYNVIGTLGKGAFAIVYQLATKQDGELFAAKQLEKRRIMKDGVLEKKIHNELVIMKDLHHVSHEYVSPTYHRLIASISSQTSYSMSDTKSCRFISTSSWNMCPMEI